MQHLKPLFTGTRWYSGILAWSAHLYTALGLVAAAGMAVLLIQNPGQNSFLWVFRLMFLATLIDATDGWLARWARVHEVTPQFEGRRLDDLVDFQTYAALPLLLIWRAGLLPTGQEWWLLLPLLASAYGFSQAQAKTEDGFFLGFPSYWNVIAFYLYYLRPSGRIAVTLLAGFALLTFVPSRYLYPSQRGRLNLWTSIFGAAWGVLILLVLWPAKEPSSLLVWLSLSYPVYYLLASWTLSLRRGNS